MTISIPDLIRLCVTILQIVLYLIIFFKLHRLKGNKSNQTSFNIPNLLNKGKELFKKYVGEIDITKLLFGNTSQTGEDEDPSHTPTANTNNEEEQNKNG